MNFNTKPGLQHAVSQSSLSWPEWCLHMSSIGFNEENTIYRSLDTQRTCQANFGKLGGWWITVWWCIDLRHKLCQSYFFTINNKLKSLIFCLNPQHAAALEKREFLSAKSTKRLKSSRQCRARWDSHVSCGGGGGGIKRACNVATSKNTHRYFQVGWGLERHICDKQGLCV